MRAPMDKSERRQQLLLAAKDIFAKRGYHAAKIDDIVAAAGVARGTFYLYFQDKRGIFEELVDRAFARLGMAIVRVDPKADVPAQVRENIFRIMGALLEDKATTKLLLSDAMGVDPAFDRKLNIFYEGVTKLLEESLQEGQELGLVGEGDPRTLAILTIGAMKELLYQVVRRDLPMGEMEIVGALYAFLSRGFLRI